MRAVVPVILILAAAAPARAADDLPLRRAIDQYLAADPLAGPAPPGELGRLCAAAENEAKAPWQFTAALYLWATGIEGDVGANGLTTSIDVPFSELFDDLTGAFMARFGARKGRWGILADVFWSSLEDSQTGPIGGTVKAEVDLFIGELTGSYRAVEHGDAEANGLFALDLYAGARVYSVTTEITTALASPGDSATWVDPIVGFDARFLVRKWGFTVRADIGGFDVSSELCWSVMAGVAYRCSRIFWLAAGYRWLDIDFERGPLLDVQLAGPYFAFAFAW